MDTQRKMIRLDDEPSTVTFDTGYGALTFPVEPYEGPGTYEVALMLLPGTDEPLDGWTSHPASWAVTYAPRRWWERLLRR